MKLAVRRFNNLSFEDLAQKTIVVLEDGLNAKGSTWQASSMKAGV